MLDRRRFLASTVAAVTFGFANGGRAVASRAIDADAFTAYLESVRAEANIPALAAAMSVGGSIVYTGATGTANIRTQAPEQPATVFLIASISKTMTAVAVMQLVERGKVKLDEEIQSYAPWFPRKQKPITIRHLLTHTSGIHHYDVPTPRIGSHHYATFEESTRSWRNDPLEFDPGTHWLYSSFGVALVQAVVETASGTDFETYLRTNIWQPARMTMTQLDVTGRDVARDQGYDGSPKSPPLRPAFKEDDSYKYAAGGVLSTDADLCLYAGALNAGKLLGSDGRAEMYRLQLPASVTSFRPSNEAPSEHQALIWQRNRDREGNTFFEHSGSGQGTISELINFPDRDVAVAVHRNSREGPSLLRIARKLATLGLQ